MQMHRIHLNLDDVGHPPCIIVKNKVQVEKRHFLLKEKAIFGTFLSIVRYLPYYCKKTSKNASFFKGKMPFSDPCRANVLR